MQNFIAFNGQYPADTMAGEDRGAADDLNIKRKIYQHAPAYKELSDI